MAAEYDPASVASAVHRLGARFEKRDVSDGLIRTDGWLWLDPVDPGRHVYWYLARHCVFMNGSVAWRDFIASSEARTAAFEEAAGTAEFFRARAVYWYGFDGLPTHAFEPACDGLPFDDVLRAAKAAAGQPELLAAIGGVEHWGWLQPDGSV